MKKTKESSVEQGNEKAHICRGRGLYETKLLVFRKSSVLEGKGKPPLIHHANLLIGSVFEGVGHPGFRSN